MSMNYLERKAKQSTETQARKEAHDALTLEQKIEKAKTRPGNSTKEISRLQTLIEERNERQKQVVEKLEKSKKGATAPVGVGKNRPDYHGRTKNR